jgi:hypothetical protein
MIEYLRDGDSVGVWNPWKSAALCFLSQHPFIEIIDKEVSPDFATGGKTSSRSSPPSRTKKATEAIRIASCAFSPL